MAAFLKKVNLRKERVMLWDRNWFSKKIRISFPRTCYEERDGENDEMDANDMV